MRFRARLTGVRDVTRALERIGRVASGPVLEKSVRAGAEIIAEEARQLVPVRSGQLRDSIMVSTASAWPAQRWPGATHSGADIGVSRLGVSLFVGPALPGGWYGHMVEFGTSDTPAQPFMRPAFDAKKNAALAAMADSLRVEFRKVRR